MHNKIKTVFDERSPSLQINFGLFRNNHSKCIA